MDKNQKIKPLYIVFLFLLCIVLNVGGHFLAVQFKLPVWLDMVGTCLAVYYLGLPLGSLAALLNNLLAALFNHTSLIYGLTVGTSAENLYLLL